jgi:hypothetical protein
MYARVTGQFEPLDTRHVEHILKFRVQVGSGLRQPKCTTIKIFNVYITMLRKNNNASGE